MPQITPFYINNIFNSAFDAFTTKEFDECARILDENHNLFKGHDEKKYLLLKAKVENHRHNFEYALEIFNKYESLPNSEQLDNHKVSKSITLINLGHYDQAMSLLNSITDKSYYDHLNLILCSLKLDNYSLARLHLMKLFPQNPQINPTTDPRACVYFAQFFANKKNRTGTYKWLEHASSYQNDPLVLETLAQCSAYFGDLEKLESTLESLKRLTPKFQQTHELFLAKYHAHQGDIEKSIQIILNLVQHTGWSMKALLCITDCFEAVGDHEQAAMYYKFSLGKLGHIFKIRKKADEHAQAHPEYYRPSQPNLSSIPMVQYFPTQAPISYALNPSLYNHNPHAQQHIMRPQQYMMAPPQPIQTTPSMIPQQMHTNSQYIMFSPQRNQNINAQHQEIQYHGNQFN